MKARNPQAIFGIFDYGMIPKMKRKLREVGVEMVTRSDRNNWGDQIEITFEPMADFVHKPVVNKLKLKQLKDRIVKAKAWTPKVGDYIYVETRGYIDHGEDDVMGGLAEVKEVSTQISGGEPTAFVSVKQHPGSRTNWSQFLFTRQANLMKEFGTQFARPDPDC